MSFLIPVDFEVSIVSPWAVEKWNGYDTKSSLPTHEAYLEFVVTFGIKNITHTSPQVVLSNRSMVYVSSPRHWCFALLPTSNKLMWSLGRIRVKHTCIAHIAKSNNGSMEKKFIHSDQGVHVCGSRIIMITPWQ